MSAVLELAESTSDFMADFPAAFQITNYLSTLDPWKWKPSVVVVKHEGKIAGVLLAKERKMLGIPIGWIHVDITLNHTLAAHAEHFDSVFLAAIRALFHVRTYRFWRIRVPRQVKMFSAIRTLASRMNLVMTASQRDRDSRLALPANFLYGTRGGKSIVSSNTRRNLLVRGRTHGQTFKILTVPEFRAAAATIWMKTQEKYIKTPAEIDSVLVDIQRMKKPLLVGVQAGNGQWLSLGAGWFEEDTEIFQLKLQINNEEDLEKGSPNMLLRGYLIEQLIAEGHYHELVFPGGAGGHLEKYVNHFPYILIGLDPRASIGVRHFLVYVQPYLPQRWKNWVRWNLDIRPPDRTKIAA